MVKISMETEKSMLSKKEHFYRELDFWENNMSYNAFDVYYTDFRSEPVISNEYLDFLNCFTKEIIDRNKADEIYKFSRWALAIEHKDENVNDFSFIYNGAEINVQRKVVRFEYADNDYKNIISIDANHIEKISKMNAILQAKSWLFPPFYEVLLSENHEEYDVYCTESGHPKLVHDRYGGNCIKDFADRLSEIIRSGNETTEVYAAGLFDFAIIHKKTDMSGFTLDYGGIMHKIEKKTILIK